MIKFENVSKLYGTQGSGLETKALSNINLFLRSGELSFITGHSGAGKTTMLRLIMGLTMPTAGNLIVANYNIGQLSKSQLPFYRRNLGMIFQNPCLLPNRTVFENIELPLIIAGLDTIERRRLVRAALDKVSLSHKEKSYPLMLSTGEQQRVGIARAVVTKPKILLADEPTGNLDPVLSSEIMKLFEAFRQVGVCILIATHDLALIARLQYRIITICGGELINIEDTEHTEYTAKETQELIYEQ
ncbi:MAG: ATP-binding cassette domain-containing protein [Gammaproteobacteria bacterium]|nr:ATP-binding cassette domain-containing protein [Gammaproteobacteria bacterium]